MSVPALRQPKTRVPEKKIKKFQSEEQLKSLKQPKVSVPVRALRQPKNQVRKPEKPRNFQNDQEFLILTLKNSVKLVIRSDSYHCVRNVDHTYICVLCNKTMELENKVKESHKNLPEHQRLLKIYPYLEELAENLIRQINNSSCYCTICSIVTSIHSVAGHIESEEHKHELNRAMLRADSYKPCESFVLNSTDDNNNK